MDLGTIKETEPWYWPVDASSIFLETLRDGRADQSDRLIAAELAGNITVINQELVEALLAVVRSTEESEPLRCQAAISLGPVLEHADTEGFDGFSDVPISESTFRMAQDSLRDLYLDAQVPKAVRRRILEAAVRAPREWHQDPVRAAYLSDDEDWKLTAVFCMRWVRGFEQQILEALGSDNQDLHYEAVCAAGNWEVDAAWPHVSALVTSPATDKQLLLAAIDAVASIRPQQAAAILNDLTASEDDEIVETAFEAMVVAGVPLNGVYDDEADQPW